MEPLQEGREATALATDLPVHGVAVRIIWISEGCPVSILVHHTYLLDKETAGWYSVPKSGSRAGGCEDSSQGEAGKNTSWEPTGQVIPGAVMLIRCLCAVGIPSLLYRQLKGKVSGLSCILEDPSTVGSTDYSHLHPISRMALSIFTSQGEEG